MRLTFTIAIWLLTAACIGTVAWFSIAADGAPKALAPLPLTTLAPAWKTAEWASRYLDWPLPAEPLYAVLPAVFFLLVSYPLSRGTERVPAHSLLLFGFLAVATILYFMAYGRYGPTYHGLRYTLTVAVMNLLAILVVGALALRGRRQPTYLRSYLFHTSMFLWLAWFSFPWLGEGI